MYEFELNLDDAEIQLRTDVSVAMYKDRWDSPGHNHAQYEVHVMLAGEAVLDVEGRRDTLKKGEMFVVAPGQYHCGIADAGTIERFSFMFGVSGGPMRHELLSAVPDYRILPTTPAILEACRDIFCEASEPSVLSRMMIQSRLTTLLVCCLRQLDVSTAPIQETDSPEEEAYTTRIDRFFRTYQGEKVGVDDLAAELYMSRGQTNRLLRKIYGMTFREKLIRSRMEQAVRFLRYTDLAVYQIAEKVGYTASSSFYHAFRERLGMTPEEYRAMTAEAENPD